MDEISHRKVPHKFKGKLYHSTIKLAILYVTKCWVVKSQQDTIRNECFREKVEVALFTGKRIESCIR